MTVIGGPTPTSRARNEAQIARDEALTRMYSNMGGSRSTAPVQNVMQEDRGFLSEQSLQDTVDVLYERGMNQVRSDLASRGMADSSMMAQAGAQMSGEALLGAWQVQEGREQLRLQQRQQDIQQQQWQKEFLQDEERIGIQRSQVESQALNQARSIQQREQQAERSAQLRRREADQQYQLSMAQLESQDAWTAMRAALESAPADQSVVDEFTDLSNRMSRSVWGQSGTDNFSQSPESYVEDYMEQDFMSDYQSSYDY